MRHLLSALLLIGPGIAHATTILHPARIPVASGEYAYDVVPVADGGSPDEGTLLIVTDDTSTCTVWNAFSGGTQITGVGGTTGTAGHYERTLNLTSVSYTSGDIWRVECGSAVEYFRIVDESAPEILLYDETPTGTLTPAESYLYELALAYDGGVQPDGGTTFNTSPLLWTSTQDPWRSALYLLLENAEVGAVIGPEALDAGCTKSVWTDCGLPRHEGSTNDPDYDLFGVTAGRNPLDRLTDSGSSSVHLLRISFAALLAQTCFVEGLCDNDSNGDTTPLLADDYVAAASYWARTILAQDWTMETWFSTDNADLYWSRNLRASAVAYQWMHPYIGQEQRHEWLAALVQNTQAFYGVDKFNLDPMDQTNDTDGAHYSYNYAQSPPWNNLAERALRNGHLWERNAALGVAAMVLEESFADSAARPSWDAWDSASSTAMGAVFSALGACRA